MTAGNRATFEQVWASVAARYEAYAPVWPGDPSFICQPHSCDAYCCRTMSVSLGDGEVARMTAASGREPIAFLEAEDGSPIELPLLKPYLLKRHEAKCAMLAPDLSCGEYEGRPDACRQYPYQLLIIDADRGKPARIDATERDAALARTLTRAPIDPTAVAFLVRHTPCPGFTGPGTAEADWAALYRSTATAQFGDISWSPAVVAP